MTSQVSVVHLVLIRLRTPETLKWAWKYTRRPEQTLTTSFCQSTYLTASTTLPHTTVPSSRIAVFTLVFSQASGTGIDKTSRTAHLFSSYSTSLLGVAAVSTSKKSPQFYTLVARHHFLLWRAAYSSLVQYPEEIELVDPSALSNATSAERRSAAAVTHDHASRLHLAVLPESLK